MSFLDTLARHSAGKHAKGCTDSEVASLEKRFGVILPRDYKQFLICAGHRYPGFFAGSDFEYEKLGELQEWAADLLRENCHEPLGKESFVFMMHQGYQFYFFDGEIVYYYMEGEEGFQKRFDSFGEFFCKHA